MLLRIAFTVAPILFGIDKFANVLTDDWTRYLAVELDNPPRKRSFITQTTAGPAPESSGSEAASRSISYP